LDITSSSAGCGGSGCFALIAAIAAVCHAVPSENDHSV
jgi:hypothetical protein